MDRRAISADGRYVTFYGTGNDTLVGGTGKLKGLKGQGTCKGKGASDGSVTWDCEGTFEPAK